MTETWMPIPIPGYEGWYEASDIGRIRRSPKHLPKRRGPAGKPLSVFAACCNRKSSRPPKLRPRVNLTFNYQQRSTEIGRLVALAFHGIPPDGHQVNHKDGNPWNNSPDNLEWVTRRDNMRHAHAHKLLNLQVGVEQTQAKLTDDAVREIRKSTESKYALARKFGVSANAIRLARHRITWKHVI